MPSLRKGVVENLLEEAYMQEGQKVKNKTVAKKKLPFTYQYVGDYHEDDDDDDEEGLAGRRSTRASRRKAEQTRLDIKNGIEDDDSWDYPERWQDQ